MRFTLTLLGRQVLEVSIDRAEQPNHDGEHDHLAAQVELAGDCPIGFHIEPNPSLGD